MKKPVLARIAGLVVLYCVVFTGLVILQFTKKGNFSRRIGAMTVSGQYALPADSGDSRSDSADGDAASLVREVEVYFGGLDFSLWNRDTNGGFVLIGANGERTQALAETMETADNAARFEISGGTEILFETFETGEAATELRISAAFASGVEGVDIPARLQRASLHRDSEGGQISVVSNNVSYMFSHPVDIDESGVLSLRGESPAIAYRPVPEQTAFNPADFIVANTGGAQFSDALARIGDQDFLYWSRNISAAGEDEVVAYCGESVSRGNYKVAVGAVPQVFLSGAQRSHVSSVFLGGMNAALRSFAAAERARVDRVSQMINEGSPDFLLESHVFEFLLARGYVNIAEEGLELIRSIDPADLTPELCPGIFEGYMDIRVWRSHGDNPFERLADAACHVFSHGIRRDAEKDQTLVFEGDTADIEYNLRLGKALWTWADAAGRADWVGLGRSIALSVLLMRDSAGAVPSSAQLSDMGGFSAGSGTRLSAARVHRVLRQGGYFPRAAGIGSGVSGLWAWTAASSVGATQENNVLDISVTFPAGETHYMMIRGIRPFTKIQIYNLDYPTDPQFERYDSSGWIYSAQEQILVLKMKHRAAVEHIKIFY